MRHEGSVERSAHRLQSWRMLARRRSSGPWSPGRRRGTRSSAARKREMQGVARV